MLSFYEKHKDKIKNARKQYHEKFYRLNKVNSRYKQKRDSSIKLYNNSNLNYLNQSSSSFNKIKKAKSFISPSTKNKMLTPKQQCLLNNKRSDLNDLNYYPQFNTNKQHTKSPKPEPLPMKINLTHIGDNISNNKLDPIQEDKKMIYLLSNLGLENLYGEFNKNCIKFNDLFLLTKEDFIEMKIPIGPRNRLIHFIREFLKYAITFNFQELHDFLIKYKKSLNESLINRNKSNFNNNCHPIINNFLNAGDNANRESFEMNSNKNYKNNTYDKVNLSNIDNVYKSNRQYCKKQINFDQINDNNISNFKNEKCVVCLSETNSSINKKRNNPVFSYDNKNVIFINKNDLQNENIRNLTYELNKNQNFNIYHPKQYNDNNFYKDKMIKTYESNTYL